MATRRKQRSEPAVFIVNPQAGGGKSERQLKDLLSEIASIYGNAKIVFTERRLHATEIARAAIKAGAELIVAVGGDGTISEVAAGFFDEEGKALKPVKQAPALGILPAESGEGGLLPQELGMAEVLLTPRSRLAGQTLKSSRFRDKYRVTVVGIMRLGKPVTTDLGNLELRFGDTLLVHGTWQAISLLSQETHDFVVVGQPAEMALARPAAQRAPVALAIMVGMLLLLVFELVPAVVAVLLAAVAMVLTGCLSMEDAYRNMNWQSLILLAGMLPMSTALQKTGGVQFVADFLVGTLGRWGPLAVIVGLFLLAGFFSQFISNTATTVLIAPIALKAALSLGVAPHAFLMVVAVAASTAFATPIATVSNTLVLGSGNYSFADFARVGIPLQLLIMAAILGLLPFLFPF